MISELQLHEARCSVSARLKSAVWFVVLDTSGFSLSECEDVTMKLHQQTEGNRERLVDVVLQSVDDRGAELGHLFRRHKEEVMIMLTVCRAASGLLLQRHRGQTDVSCGRNPSQTQKLTVS